MTAQILLLLLRTSWEGTEKTNLLFLKLLSHVNGYQQSQVRIVEKQTKLKQHGFLNSTQEAAY